MTTHAHPATLPRGRPALAAVARILRTERGIVWTALGVIGLHVADDNFVQTAPGTGPADHLASGLIPIAVLALAGWAYPHLRAGLRAAVAMTAGALGIAFGVPGAYYLSHGAAEGDNWTGLLSIAAGVVLLAVGPVTLWRNRSHDADRRRRYTHRGITTLATIVAAPVLFAVIVFPVGFTYVYTHSGRIVEDPKLGTPYETVQFPSGSIDLTGYYVPSKNGANVVVYPGVPRSHEARMLIRHGYGVLLVDPRGQGRSEGDLDRWAGEDDLIAAAEYLQQRPGVDPARIAGFGFSIGGEQLIEAAAKSKAFAAIVSEGAGGVVGGDAEVSGAERILAKPTLSVMTGAMMLFQNEHQPPPIWQSIGKVAPRPVFLIYSDPGLGGESALQARFYAAARGPKQIWKVPGAGHTGGLDAQPRAYEQRVTSFLDQALLDR